LKAHKQSDTSTYKINFIKGIEVMQKKIQKLHIKQAQQATPKSNLKVVKTRKEKT